MYPISLADAAGAATASTPARPLPEILDALALGIAPPCTDAQLDAWIAMADRPRIRQVDTLPISDEELLVFYRDHRADRSPESWNTFMRRRVHAVYGLTRPVPARPEAGPLALLPQAAATGPDPVAAADFAPPVPRPATPPADAAPVPAHLRSPYPVPMPDIDTAEVAEPDIRAALDHLGRMQAHYLDGSVVARGMYLDKLSRLLGIEHQPFANEWPQWGEAGSELMNPQRRGAYFAGLPWSGPLTIAAMLGDLRCHRYEAAADTTGRRAGQEAHALACLKVALVDHSREIRRHDATYRALLEGRQGTPDPAPDRLVAALRSAYRRSPPERLAVMQALAFALGVTLESGPAREPYELRYALSRGYTAAHDPIARLPRVLRALEVDNLDLVQCQQLANLCLHQQLSVSDPAALPPDLRWRIELLGSTAGPDGAPLLGAPQVRALTTFFMELPKTAEWLARPDEVRALCGRLLDRALASGNRRFCEAIAAIAADACSSCEDNVGFGFDRMRLMLRFATASGLPEKLAVLRQLHLQHRVMNETFRLYGGDAPNTDLLQRALRFMVHARELDLLQDGGLAGTVHHAHLPEADLQAVADTLRRPDEEGFMRFVCDSGWLDGDRDLQEARYRDDMDAIDRWAQHRLEEAERTQHVDGDTAFHRIADERAERVAQALRQTLHRVLQREADAGAGDGPGAGPGAGPVQR